jgi:hypothetical protein
MKRGECECCGRQGCSLLPDPLVLVRCELATGAPIKSTDRHARSLQPWECDRAQLICVRCIDKRRGAEQVRKTEPTLPIRQLSLFIACALLAACTVEPLPPPVCAQGCTAITEPCASGVACTCIATAAAACIGPSKGADGVPFYCCGAP